MGVFLRFHDEDHDLLTSSHRLIFLHFIKASSSATA
jgi:hypothetical protein